MRFNINVLVNYRNCKLLKGTFNGLNMKCMVDFPTRVTYESETGIDISVKNISSNNLCAIGVITVLSDLDGQV